MKLPLLLASVAAAGTAMLCLATQGQTPTRQEPPSIDLSGLLKPPSIGTRIKLPGADALGRRIDLAVDQTLFVAPSCAKCSSRRVDLRGFLNRCPKRLIVLVDHDVQAEIGNACLKRHRFVVDARGDYLTANLGNMAPALLSIDASGAYLGRLSAERSDLAAILEEERR